MVLLFLGDIGGSELLLIAVVALLVLGPQRFPDLMRKVGSVLGQFRRASTDLQRQLNNELRDAVDPDAKGGRGGPSFGSQAAAWVSRLKSDVKGGLEGPPTPPSEATAPAAPPGAVQGEIETSELASAPDAPPTQAPPPPEAERG